MLPPPLPLTRRIVTANDAMGRSYIADDGPSPALMTIEDRPGFRNHNIWRTMAAPVPIDEPDSVSAHAGVMPPPTGTVLRVIDLPPQPSDPEERRRQAHASLNMLFADADHKVGRQAPGMHVTKSVDYAIVLAGTLTAILDAEETEMKTGDILIQRGTNHAWENRTDEMARIAFILIDGQ